MSLQNKCDIINNFKDKNLFYDDNLYKIVKVNTYNITAYKYKLNKELECDTSIIFYSRGDSVSFHNFENELEPNIIKLKLKHIIEKPYKIVNIIPDISNLYFIQHHINYNIIEIKMKDNYNESLFNTNDIKLNDSYDIRTFITNLSTVAMNNDTEYYKKIRAVQMHYKKYINGKYLTAEIIEMCKNELDFIKPAKYNDYINLR